MPTDITINNISGSTPFDVYVCDTGYTSCIYVSTITSGELPYTFEIPPVYSSLTNFIVKVVDDNDCVVTDTVTV
jgi:uncharacterized secreted protein with C-terminal beta-propeller domain